MTGLERREYLTGLFAVWFATLRGREKPNAKDKKDAAVTANVADDDFYYRYQFGAGGHKGTNSPEGKAVLKKLGIK
jgi:hypothetical protein